MVVGLYNGSNIGIITLESTGTSTILGEIPLGDGLSSMALFSTPDDQFGVVRHVTVSVEGNKLLNLLGCFRPRFDIVVPPVSPFITIRNFIGLEGFVRDEPKAFPVIPPRSDFFLRAVVASGTTAVSVGFDVLCVPIR